MVTDKIKALLLITGKKQIELANEFGLTAQSMSNKMALNRYNSDDLIKIAEFTGCKVGFLLPNGEHILLDTSDIRESKKKPE